MYKQISSPQNSFIKELVQLKEKSRIRKNTQTFLIEGLLEINLAIQGGYIIQTILADASIIYEDDFNILTKSIASEVEIIEISHEVYKK